jgi:exopolyphosphatase/guanosine-5'-triphosphate,3'-diphosphate pyrophosphatase
MNSNFNFLESMPVSRSISKAARNVFSVFALAVSLSVGLAIGLSTGCTSVPKTIDDPCLKRRGAIDIGSGSTKALAAVINVCSNPKRIVEKLFDEKVKISFGEALELNSEGKIPSDVIADASAKIATLVEQMNSQNLESIEAVATAAIRKSRNRDEVANQIAFAMNERIREKPSRGKTKLMAANLKVRVLSQIEEAQIGARSALANLPPEIGTGPVVIWDIGGGSMQMAAVGSDELFTGDLASVTFKNQVIREIQKKDPAQQKSPNPLKKNAKKATALARAHAEKNLGPFLDLHNQKPRWVGIGGVLALSVQKQVNREVQMPRSKADSTVRTKNHFTLDDLRKALDARANRTDDEIESDYRETEVTNLALVLGYMQALKANKVETVEASLVQGLIIH